MAISDTKNVKIGVCIAYFDGQDLGYTKGGCEVEVSTETKKVEVDQFGKSVINEVIMGRMVKAKVPMAETTIDKMALIMPGAVVSYVTPAVKATGTVTIATPVANGTVVINGKTFTFKAVVAVEGDVLLGGTPALSIVNLAAALNASTNPAVAAAQYSAATTILTVVAYDAGVAGNSFTLGAGTSGGSVSAATLAGGVEGAGKRVTVPDGVGTSLLDSARELRLHPVGLPADDKSEDFVIPLANTAGALSFAYKLEDERIYSAEFMGYPDPTTRKLYHFGV